MTHPSPYRQDTRNLVAKCRYRRSWTWIAAAIGLCFFVGQTTQILLQVQETAADNVVSSLALQSSLDRHQSFRQQNNIESAPGEKKPIKKVPSSPNAYVFMVWRCKPESDSAYYRGYLLNICIAARLLRRYGSTADIILVVQLSIDSTQSSLTIGEKALLKHCGMELRYLPKETATQAKYNEFATMFHKFYVYSMVEYEKVFYLDSDILPLNSLDYLFEMMDGSDDNGETLSFSFANTKMILIGGLFQPANGGFFLVRPNLDDYKTIQQRIQQQGERLGKQKMFDSTIGWGHQIESNDPWETNHPRTKGVLWDFWAAHGDQGFLYYYAKYALKNVTQILSRKIQTFQFNGTAIAQHVVWNVDDDRADKIPAALFQKLRRRPSPYQFVPTECSFMTGEMGGANWPGCLPPYADLSHLDKKPWKATPMPPLSNTPPTSDEELWWHMFYELRKEYREKTDLKDFLD